MGEGLMGRRRTQRADDTLRQLLLQEHRHRFGLGSRWHIPGRVSEYEQALVAGEAIVVDSGTLLCTLLHAGLPAAVDYEYGGRHWGKQWHLDVDGALSEWTAEDQAEIDPEPGAHCKGGRTCMRCAAVGADYDKTFVLDENDQLSEYTETEGGT